MAHINFLGGLKREYHHLMVLVEDREEYEPAMVLIRPTLMGRSFWIPLSCMWKYLEPKSNRDVMRWDHQEFDQLARSIEYRLATTFGRVRQEAANDAAGIVFAEALNEGSGVLLTTAFSLFKACQLLELTIGQQTLVQLLMFIQDGLDQLKNMPPAEPEDKIQVGEGTVRIDGVAHHFPVETTASDLARDIQENEG